MSKKLFSGNYGELLNALAEGHVFVENWEGWGFEIRLSGHKVQSRQTDGLNSLPLRWHDENSVSLQEQFGIGPHF